MILPLLLQGKVAEAEMDKTRKKREKKRRRGVGGLRTEKLLLRSSEIGLEELSISTQQAERRSGFIYSNAIPFLLLSRKEGEGKNR